MDLRQRERERRGKNMGGMGNVVYRRGCVKAECGRRDEKQHRRKPKRDRYRGG